MKPFSRIINTLVWMWRLTELAEKVENTEQDIIDMDSRIDARMDKSWKELDARMDAEKAKAAAGRSDLREELAYLRGTIDEISRKRHAEA